MIASSLSGSESNVSRRAATYRREWWEAELESWLAGLQAASARGDYLFSINDYIAVATKEPQSKA
jgi:hypothetical protein